MLQNFFRTSLKRQNKLECLSVMTNFILNCSAFFSDGNICTARLAA
jgi:hypothetical protein